MNIEQKQRDNQGKQPSNTPRSVEIEAKLDQAVAYHQAGQLQQAEQICQQILDINPQNADVLNLFGLIACQIGKYEIAGDLINYALEIDPNQPLFLNNLGLVLKEQDRLEEAIDVYYQALEIQPDSVGIYNNLGVALHKQG
ncbi:TPA: tetratricopeptide repeat protein, partial [Candidatus Poribacteria bacterium]|nr:tetratricopeptide repeat protein [Candidatus Poribacteria bacterium]HIO46902.1 tetratricopeptide repeat protein [Candidatus Poribacteria bacterium]